MSALRLHFPTTPSTVRTPLPLAVYVDGRRRRDLHVEAWTQQPLPPAGSATILLAGPGTDRPAKRMENLEALPPIGARLQIAEAGPAREILFDGRVSKHLTQAGPDAEQLGVEVEDFLRARLAEPIVGRWEVSDGSPTYVSTGKVAFNREPDGLASAGTYTVNSRTSRVFHSADDAQPWSVADMLDYLLAAHLPEGVFAPEPEELENLAGQVFPPAVSVTGLPLAEAIARVARLAGLIVRAGAVGTGLGLRRGLLFYRPGRSGRRRRVSLQPAGERLDLNRTNLWQAAVSFRRRPGRRGVIVLGSPKRYESTFTLQPGWDPAEESYHHRDFVRSEAADWPAVADVYRKWVLNESGAYAAAPFNLTKFDFATVSAEDFFLTRPRRFRPCLSVDATGRSLGVVVEVSYDGSEWRRYGGPVRVSTSECAIYLEDDALPADYFQAAQMHLVEVRVTATVESDCRLTAVREPDVGLGSDIIEVPAVRWEKVHSGSVFFGRQDLPAPLERDDTERIEQLADAAVISAGEAVEAELTLGWLDPSFRVGDLIERIEGRSLELTTRPDATPYVSAVEHRAEGEWTTRLSVRG